LHTQQSARGLMPVCLVSYLPVVSCRPFFAWCAYHSPFWGKWASIRLAAACQGIAVLRSLHPLPVAQSHLDGPGRASRGSPYVHNTPPQYLEDIEDIGQLCMAKPPDTVVWRGVVLGLSFSSDYDIGICRCLFMDSTREHSPGARGTWVVAKKVILAMASIVQQLPC